MEKPMSRQQRLNEAYEYLRFRGYVSSQRDLARRLNAAETNISAALNGVEKFLTDRLLKRINEAYGDLFNLDWLLYGEGEMINDNPNPQPYPKPHEDSPVSIRLKDFIATRKLSMRQFERSIGAGNSFVSNVTSGISADYLRRICSVYPMLNPDWLMTGEGNMLRDEDAIVNKDGEKEHTLPLLPIDVMAGNTTISLVGVKLEECEQYAVPDFIYYGAQMLIRVSGDSMTPRYNNGDIIALKEVSDISFFQWGKIYVLDTNQGALVKRVYEDKTNTDNVICHSENSDMYHDFSMPKSSIRKLFVVIGVIRIE